MLARSTGLRPVDRHNPTGQRPVGLCSRNRIQVWWALKGPSYLGSYSVIRSTNGHSLDRTLLYFTLKRPTASRFGHLDPTDPGCPHDGWSSTILEHSLWPTAIDYAGISGLRPLIPLPRSASLLLLFYCTIEGYDWPSASHIPASPNGPFRAH